MQISIIIDTREQTPWSFPTVAATVRFAKLSAGDYALEGDHRFAIERKSMDDFCGTVSSGWKRFLREIARMDGHEARVIIVEGRLLDCCFWEKADGELVAPCHNHHMLWPQFIMRQIAQLALMRVAVLFAEDPHIASALAYHILHARAEQLKGLFDA
jgi:ERCC4-type nuclease